MNGILKKMLLTTLIATAVAPALATTVTVYTDKAAWEAAAGAYTTEAFDDQTLTAGLGISSAAPEFSISGGVMYDRVVPGSDPTVFSFASAATAFGGNFDLTPGGAGLGLQFTLTGGEVVSFSLAEEVPQGYSGQFFGFVSDTGFTAVATTYGTQPNGAAETYTLDNLVFNAAGTDVPEPASLALVGVGLLGCAAIRRKRSPSLTGGNR